MTNEVDEKTQAEYQEMIDILKFTPRTYTIQVYGYGGEDKLDLTGLVVSAKLRAELTKKTEWLPLKVKPVHVGLYECKFKVDKKAAWPWSNTELVEWSGKAWLHETKKVEEWRGLVEQIVE